LTLEDAIDIAGRTSVLIDVISAIRHQAAGYDEVTRKVHRRKIVSRRQRDDQLAMGHRGRACRHKQAAIRSARKRRNGALDLGPLAQSDRVRLQLERGSHGLDNSKLADSRTLGVIPKDHHASDARRDLLEQLYSVVMKPVALPPGRARLATKPAATGSPTIGNTIGIARVACSNGRTVEAP